MKVTKFNGNTLATSYAVMLMGGTSIMLPAVTAALTTRVGAWPLVSGVDRPGRKLTLGISIEGTDVDTLRAQLFRWFDPEDETPKVLTVTDDDGTDERYMDVVCEALQPTSGGDRVIGTMYVATLAVHGDVRWRGTADVTDTWAITASGQTKAITNAGTDDAYPVFQITPTAVKAGGYLYKRWVPIQWIAHGSAQQYPVVASLDTAALVADSTRHVAINVGGGINDSVTTIPYDGEVGTFPTSGLAYVETEQFSYTGKTATDLTGCVRGVNGTTKAAHANDVVIYASKMQADGDDLRILVNGTETYRWLNAMNGAATKVWFSLNFQPAQIGTLKTDIASSGDITAIEFNEEVMAWPASGIALIGTEAFVFTGKDTSLQVLSGITRAAKGTSMAAHAIGASVYWIQHDVYLIYGNASVTAPVVSAKDKADGIGYDQYKPAFELDHSTNASWVYENFGEMGYMDWGDGGMMLGEHRAGRWGRWGNLVVAGGIGGVYTATQRIFTLIYSVAGAWITSYCGDSFGWYLSNPCGIINAVWANGFKRRATASYSCWGLYWPRGRGGSYPQWQLSVPTNPNAWEAWSYGPSVPDFDVSDTIGFKLYNFPGDVEVGDVTVTLSTTGIPTVTVNAEQSTYSIAATLTNSTTGELIKVAFECGMNQTLEIDTYNKTVKYLKYNSSQFQALTFVGAVRRNWLRWQPGANTLVFTDVGTTGVTLVTKFRKRYY